MKAYDFIMEQGRLGQFRITGILTSGSTGLPTVETECLIVIDGTFCLSIKPKEEYDEEKQLEILEQIKTEIALARMR